MSQTTVGTRDEIDRNHRDIARHQQQIEVEQPDERILVIAREPGLDGSWYRPRDDDDYGG